MRRWERTLIGPESTLREALEHIDSCGRQMVLVVNGDRKLLGIVTDGDVRRSLLKGATLADPVTRIMRSNPRCASVEDDQASILAMMRNLGVHHIPVIDSDGILVGLEMAEEFLLPQPRHEWVVVMAGGLGERLQELTRNTPKPMLKVGSRPLLETIVHNFVEQGFHKFYFAVNYRADQIESHFGDGATLGVEIRYLREKKRMGTAGALSLLPERPDRPLIVTNADLLTTQNFRQMMDIHLDLGGDATVGVRDYEMQVPFGVIRESCGRVQAIEEKPVHKFNVSAGINILSPNALDLVPKDEFFDMPALIETMVHKGMHVSIHRVDGYWLDIGRLHDYEKANSDFNKEFR